MLAVFWVFAVWAVVIGGIIAICLMFIDSGHASSRFQNRTNTPGEKAGKLSVGQIFGICFLIFVIALLFMVFVVRSP